MEADITWLTIFMILLVSCGLDLAGRDDAWRQLRWPWVVIAIGKVFGLRIVAPVGADAAHLAETIALIAVVTCLAALGVRWTYHRYRGRLSTLDAPTV